MIELEHLLAGLALVLNGQTFALMMLGVVIGFIVGLLPGVGGSVALALMLPFTFDMDPTNAFAFLLGMLSVTATTGDITSVLFGVPGEGISAAVVLDGHAMAKQGQAGRALGAALMSSLVGAVFGAFLLALSIPVIRPLVLSFGSPEFFGLGVLGLTFVAVVATGSVLRGLLGAGMGLMLATVGHDPQSGIQRYTFDQLALGDGIGLIPVVVGIFGIPELVDMWVRGRSIAEQPPGAIGGVWQGVRDTFTHWGVVLRCSAIGVVVGVIPGLGGSVAQWVAYGHAVQSADDQSAFGTTGDVRGVLGPGAANNSKEAGGLLPTIAFGVPGSVSMAVLLGAFLIAGLVPGPDMLTKHLDLTFSFVWVIVLSNVVTVAICFLFMPQLAKLTFVRSTLLIPPIILLIFLGSFANANTMFDVVLTLVFGFLGLLMIRLDWSRPALLLGLVLGTLLERNLYISYSLYDLGFLIRPVFLVIAAIALAVIFQAVVQRLRRRRTEGSGELGNPALEIIATGVMIPMVALAMWAGRDWPFRTLLFPWTIGGVLLAVAFARLVLAGRTFVLAGLPSSGPRSVLRGAFAWLDARAAIGLIWILVFFFAVLLLGFRVGAPLATLAFLVAARERWRVVLGIVLSTYVFLAFGFSVLLNVPLPDGAIIDLLGIPALDAPIVDGARALLH